MNNISNHESRKIFIEIPSFSFLDRVVGMTYGLGEAEKFSDALGANLSCAMHTANALDVYKNKRRRSTPFFFHGSLKSQIMYQGGKQK